MGSLCSPMGVSVSPAASSAFAPTDISGLSLWLNPTALVLNNNDPVSSYSDSSGNSNTFSASGSARPTYKTNVYNSLAMVRFDGAANTMTATRNSGLEPAVCTLFAVVRGGSAPSAFSYMISKKLNAGASTGYSLGVNGSSNSRGLCNVVTSGEKSSSTVLSATVWDGSPHIVCIVINGSLIFQYFDGNSIGIPAVAAVGNINYDSNDLRIGAYDSGSLFWSGDLGDALIYNTALSDVNRWKVQGYLGSKWAIAS